MRLLTHNMLQCHVKGCITDNFPLIITNAVIELVDAEFNAEFVERLLLKIDWDALTLTAHSLGLTMPTLLPEPTLESLESLHQILLQNGDMTCKGCGHIYPIRDSICNMLLQESEV